LKACGLPFEVTVPPVSERSRIDLIMALFRAMKPGAGARAIVPTVARTM